MGIIIKQLNEDFSKNKNAKKFYFDALTTENTLLLYDFSRKTMIADKLTNNTDVIDLGSKGYGDTIFKITSSANKDLDFVKNGSFLLKNTSKINGENTGFNLEKEIQNYLTDNNVTRLLLIFWIKNPINNLNGHSVFTTKSISYNLIRCISETDGSIIATLGNAATNRINIGDNFAQIAIEYVQGEQANVYVNSVFNHKTTRAGGVFNQAIDNFIIGQNTGSDGNNSTVELGWLILEDLTKSSINALDFINKDFNYVNALGEFEGIENRPYSNI